MVLIAAWPAHAAIAVVQTAFCEAQGAATCNAGPITTTNGNLFVASTSYCCDTFTSITDSKLNVYGNSIPDTSDGTGGTIRQDFKAAGTGGASHTFTVTGGSAAFFATLSVQEVSGAASSPLDQVAVGSDASGTSHTTASTAATAQANELLIGIGGGISTTTFINDSGAGWTEQTNVTTDADSEGGIISTRIVSAIGTYAFTFSTGTSRATASGISTWKEAAAGTRQRCIGCGTDKRIIGE